MWKPHPEGVQDWPYSQSRKPNGRIIPTAGQTAMRNGILVQGGIVEHTRQAIHNCMTIIHDLGKDERHVVHVRVVIRKHKKNREGFEQVYNELFPDPHDRPTRSLIGAKPVNGSLVDIEMWLSEDLPEPGKSGEPEDRGPDREVGHTDLEAQGD